jgi:nitrate reductase delta subunit
VRFGRRGRPPYKLLSLFLQYPDECLLEARAELARAVEELPASYERACLQRFCKHWLAVQATNLQQDYVETFDLQRRSALYLSYYVYGDTRKRGMSLLQLNRMYRAAGLVKQDGELPDYLPLMLEFAELAPAGYGRQVLVEYHPSLEMVRRSLRARGSPYAELLDAICHDLPALNPFQQQDLVRLAAEGPPSEQVGLQPFAPPEVMPAMEPRR